MDLDFEGWQKILEIYPDMDFSKELADTPELSKYLKQAINAKSVGLDRPEEMPNRPKLDDDFSRFVVINGVPKCDTKKSEKLTALLIKLFSKKAITIDADNIEHNFDGADPPMTTG